MVSKKTKCDFKTFLPVENHNIENILIKYDVKKCIFFFYLCLFLFSDIMNFNN